MVCLYQKLRFIQLAAFIFFLSVSACKEEKKFQSQNGSYLPKSVKLFKTQCDEQSGAVSLKSSFRGHENSFVQVEGQFCSLKEQSVKYLDKLSIVFMNDISGSTLTTDKGVLQGCGRLQAAAAVVNKIKQEADPRSEIKIALVNFAETATQEVQLVNINEFEKYLTTDSFCKSRGGTNYEAALKSAKRLLENVKGEKIAYFVTDGEPTSNDAGLNGSAACTSAFQAADNLRSLSQLTLNAVFLSGPNLFQQNDLCPGISSKRELLARLTGDEKRVAEVDQASDLPAALLRLTETHKKSLDAGLTKDRTQVSLSVPTTGATKKIGPLAIFRLASNVQMAQQSGMPTSESEPSPVVQPKLGTNEDISYYYKTPEISLWGQPGQVTPNLIKIKVQNTDGTFVEANIQIDFWMEAKTNQ